MKAKVGITGTLNMEISLGRFKDFPGWGKQTLGDILKVEEAGSALRVAFPLLRLGLNPYVMGIVGNDLYGESILAKIIDYGLSQKLVRRIENKPTGICISLIRKDGERTLLSYLGALEDLEVSHLCIWEGLLGKGDYMLLTGYFVLPGLRKGNLSSFFQRMRRKGVKILLDTGWDPEDWGREVREEIISLLREVDILLPNREEASIISGQENLEEIMEGISRYGPQKIFLKLGKKGSAVYTEGKIYKKNAFPVKVKDTTAAGEVFNAGVIFGLVKDWKEEKILEFSNALVSLVISHSESEYPELKKVKEWIAKNKGEEKL